MSQTKSTKKNNKKGILLTAISALLTAVLVLSGVGIYLKVTHKEKNPIVEVGPLDFSIDAWDGTIEAVNFNENYAGRGVYTKTINSAASFAHFVREVNNGNDYSNHIIYLNSSIDLNGQTIDSIGTDEHPFRGIFDGGYYTIYNANVRGGGLFGVTENAEIKNVGLYNANASLINKAINTNIENVFVRLGSGNIANEYISNNTNHFINNVFVDSDAEGLISKIDTNNSRENYVAITNSYYVIGEKAIPGKVVAFVTQENVIKATKISDFENWDYSSEYDATKKWCDYDYLEGSRKLNFNHPIQSGFVKTYLTGSCYESVVKVGSKTMDTTNLAEAFKEADKEAEAEVNLLVEKIFMEAQAEVSNAEVKINALKDTTIVRGENNEESMFVGNGTSKIVLGEEINTRSATATLTLDGNREQIEANNLESDALIVAYGGTVEIHDNVVIKNNINNSEVGYGAVLLYNTSEPAKIKATFENCHSINGGGAVTAIGNMPETLGSAYGCSSETTGYAVYLSMEAEEPAMVSAMQSKYGKLSNIRPMVEPGETVNTNTTISDATFDGNDYEGCAGIYADNVTLTIGNDVLFANNEAENGAAIYVYGGAVNITGSNVRFEYNYATWCGGAIYVQARKDEASLNITGEVNFDSNFAESCGGAIYVENGEYLTVSSGAWFGWNGAVEAGGAIYIAEGDWEIATSPYFGMNTTLGGYGGAIHCCSSPSSTLTITGDPIFERNGDGGDIESLTECGGAIYAANVKISGTPYFTQNGARVYGGAIAAEFTVEVEATGSPVFLQNGVYYYSEDYDSVTPSGGAIYCEGTVDLKGMSYFVENQAMIDNSPNEDMMTQGGAIYAQSEVTISGDVYFEKNAAYGGGAIVCFGDADAKIEISGNPTFKGNEALLAAAIASANVTISGSPIFAENCIYDSEVGAAIYVEGDLEISGNFTLENNYSDTASYDNGSPVSEIYCGGTVLMYSDFTVLTMNPTLNTFYLASSDCYISLSDEYVENHLQNKTNAPSYLVYKEGLMLYDGSSTTGVICYYESDASDPYISNFLFVVSNAITEDWIFSTYQYSAQSYAGIITTGSATESHVGVNPNPVAPGEIVTLTIADYQFSRDVSIRGDLGDILELQTDLLPIYSDYDYAITLDGALQRLQFKALSGGLVTLLIYVGSTQHTVTINVDYPEDGLWLSTKEVSGYAYAPIEDIIVHYPERAYGIKLRTSDNTIVDVSTSGFITQNLTTNHFNIANLLTMKEVGIAKVYVDLYSDENTLWETKSISVQVEKISTNFPFGYMEVAVGEYIDVSVTVGTSSYGLSMTSSNPNVVAVTDAPMTSTPIVSGGATMGYTYKLGDKLEAKAPGVAKIHVRNLVMTTSTSMGDFIVKVVDPSDSLTISKKSVDVTCGEDIDVSVIVPDKHVNGYIKITSENSDVVSAPSSALSVGSLGQTFNLKDSLTAKSAGTTNVTISLYSDSACITPISSKTVSIKVEALKLSATTFSMASGQGVDVDVTVAKTYSNGSIRVNIGATTGEIHTIATLGTKFNLAEAPFILASAGTITVNLYSDPYGVMLVESKSLTVTSNTLFAMSSYRVEVEVGKTVDASLSKVGTWYYYQLSSSDENVVKVASTVGTTSGFAYHFSYVTAPTLPASISSYLTAVGPGTATITIKTWSMSNSTAGVSGSFVVTVYDPAKRMAFTDKATTALIGEGVDVSVTIPDNYINGYVRLTSSNPTVVLAPEGVLSVNSLGQTFSFKYILSAKAIGSAKVTVELFADRDCKTLIDSQNISVSVEAMSISATTYTILEGQNVDVDVKVSSAYLGGSIRVSVGGVQIALCKIATLGTQFNLADEPFNLASAGTVSVQLYSDENGFSLVDYKTLTVTLNSIFAVSSSHVYAEIGEPIDVSLTKANSWTAYQIVSSDENIVKVAPTSQTAVNIYYHFGGYTAPTVPLSLASYLTAVGPGTVTITIKTWSLAANLPTASGSFVITVYDPSTKMDVSTKTKSVFIGDEVNVSIKIPNEYLSGYVKLTSSNPTAVEAVSEVLSVSSLGQTFNLKNYVSAIALGNAEINVELYADEACLNLIDSKNVAISVSAMTLSATQYYLRTGEKVNVIVNVSPIYLTGYIRVDVGATTGTLYAVSTLGKQFNLGDNPIGLASMGTITINLYSDENGSNLVDSKTLTVTSASTAFALSSYNVTAMKNDIVDVSMTSSSITYYYQIISDNESVVKVTTPVLSISSTMGTFKYHFLISSTNSLPYSLSSYLTAVGPGTATLTIKCYYSGLIFTGSSFLVTVIDPEDSFYISPEFNTMYVDEAINAIVNIPSQYPNGVIKISSSDNHIVNVATSDYIAHLDGKVDLKEYLKAVGLGSATITVALYENSLSTVAIETKTLQVVVEASPAWLTATNVEVLLGEKIDVGLNYGMTYMLFESSDEKVVKVIGTLYQDEIYDSTTGYSSSIEYHLWTSTAPAWYFNLGDYVSAVGVGAAQITIYTAEYENPQFVKSACVTVRVYDPENVLHFSPKSYEGYKGEPVEVVANIPSRYPNAVIKIRSSDTHIVDVSTNAFITHVDGQVDLSKYLRAVNLGTATITVEMYENSFATTPLQTKTFSVKVQNRILEPCEIQVAVGESFTIKYTAPDYMSEVYNVLVSSDDSNIVAIGDGYSSLYSLSAYIPLDAVATGTTYIRLQGNGYGYQNDSYNSISFEAICKVVVLNENQFIKVEGLQTDMLIGEELQGTVILPERQNLGHNWMSIESSNNSVITTPSGLMVEEATDSIDLEFAFNEYLSVVGCGETTISIKLYSGNNGSLADSEDLVLVKYEATIRVSSIRVSATEYYLFDGQKVDVQVEISQLYRDGSFGFSDGDTFDGLHNLSEIGLKFNLGHDLNFDSVGTYVLTVYDSSVNIVDSITLKVYSAGSQFALSSYSISAMVDTAINVSMVSSEDYYYYEIISSNESVVKVANPTGSNWWTPDRGIDYHFEINAGEEDCPVDLSQYLTAVGKGTATITIRSIHMSSDPGASGSFVVTVIGTPLITLDKTEVATQTEGSVDVNVTAIYQNSTYITIKSLNEEVVSVKNPTGTNAGNGKTHLTLNKDETVSIKNFLIVEGAGTATVVVTAYSATEGVTHPLSFKVTSSPKKLDAPILNPICEDNGNGLITKISWSPVEHADDYNVQIYRNGAISTMPVVTTNPYFDVSSYMSVSAGGYYVKVQARVTSSNDYATSDYSAASATVYARSVNIVKGAKIQSVKREIMQGMMVDVTTVVLVPGQSMLLTATPTISGYVANWTSSNNALQISKVDNLNATIKMDDGNTSAEAITLTVSAKEAGYNVTLIVNESSYGSVSQTSFIGDLNAQITTDGNKLIVGDTEVVATPKPATVEYTYVFTEWTGVIDTLTRDVTIMANFERTRNNYDVTFTIQENSVGYGLISNGASSLQTQTINVPYGTTITFENNVVTLGMHTITAVPTATSPEYAYSFVNWNGAIEVVNGDVEIFVEFTRTTRSYTVTFVSNDITMGEVTQPEVVAIYGTEVVQDGNKITVGLEEVYAIGKGQIGGYIYSFDRWIGVVSPVTRDITITAVFIRTPVKYTITVTKQNGEYGNVSVAQFESYYGAPISNNSNVLTVGLQYVYATPIDDTAQYDYKFIEWIYEGDVVVGDMEIVAKFDYVVKTYDVTIAVSENGVISNGTDTENSISVTVDYDTKIVIKDNTITIGEGENAVTFIAVADEGYTFEKWSGIVGSVRGAITIRAVFA